MDTIAPNYLLDLIEAQDPSVLIAPTLPFGAADDLLGYPGTLSIGYDLLYQITKRLTDQLYDYGRASLCLPQRPRAPISSRSPRWARSSTAVAPVARS